MKWVPGLMGLGLAACSELSDCDTSDDGNEPNVFVDGTVEEGVYMSSAWTGTLLPFAGGTRYDLEHKLGCIPREIGCWVSFGSGGTLSGSVAQSAGNLCVIQEVSEKRIRIKNDTCSDLHVLVTASGCKAPGS